MRNPFYHIFFLLVFITSSCVTRIDPPQEGESQLHIEMEMMRNHELTAKLKTSNTLNGIFPIEKPDVATIRVWEPGVDTDRKLIWDEDRMLYTYTLQPGDPLLTPNRTVRLEAFIEGKDIPKLESETRVPNFGKLEGQEVIDSRQYDDGISGEKYWEHTFRFSPMRLYPTQSIYYQLKFSEQLASLEIAGTDSVYTNITALPTELEILSFTEANFGVKQFNHQEGLFIKLEDLESDFIEVKLRSKEPISSSNVVTRFIETDLISITEENYDYHRGLHNIKQSESSIFGEAALYRSNIENGLGVFSACVQKKDHFYLK